MNGADGAAMEVQQAGVDEANDNTPGVTARVPTGKRPLRDGALAMIGVWAATNPPAGEVAAFLVEVATTLGINPAPGARGR